MNYYKLILEGLREWATIVTDEKKVAGIYMLSHFIEIMGEEKFNNKFETYFLNKPDFDSAFHDFHKSMRQTDFYDMHGLLGGHLDMLFWQFIRSTDLPYNVFKTFVEKIKIGVIDEFDNDINGSMGWDKFGLFKLSIF
jgi:hypothetical protein